ncbi:MAG: flagellar basal-body rod protein FlgF [Magnetococcales bacterium]|nr:flagellar basal-body rod protein FlgF [Magnetococcales bacterium]
MESGLYAAVNGARRIGLRMEVLSNNLANVNTTGFKGDQISFESFMTKPGPEQFPLPTDSFMGLRGPGDIPFPFSNPAANAYRMTYPMAVNTTTNMTQGSMKETGNPLDVAIEGEGFFILNGPNGRRYSRDGSFAINANRELVNKEGLQVLGSGGAPITIETDGLINVGKDGTLTDPSGTRIGQLDRVKLPANMLTKTGKNLYSAPQELEAPIDETGVGGFHQGYLEGSNTESLREMTQMIDSNRAYEGYMKMIQTLDSLDEQANNQIGKLR